MSELIQHAERTQRRASDPASSVWVAASAGTGKTKVLTDRVLRLLLAGTNPGRILCLTFTKAAAAEMSNRLFDRLASWAAKPEAELLKDLSSLMGRSPEQDEITTARRLFAGVLDAPEGLRIETLHGFAQSILRRFPVEAGVSPTFEILDDRSTQDMLAKARENVFLGAVPGSELDRAIGAITDRVSDSTFPDLIAAMTGNRVAIRRMLDAWGGRHAALAGLSDYLGIAADADAAAILAAACGDDVADVGELRRLCATMLDVGGKTDKAAGATMADWLAADGPQRIALWDDYITAYLTAKGEPRSTGRFPCKAVQTSDPDFIEIYVAEQERVLRVQNQLQSARLRDATSDLLTLAEAMFDAYEAQKRRAGWLDYDDLIQKALTLLSASEARPWVLYKLDGGLDHILVDEAQDTSADQWAVVDALTAEFFAGEGTRDPDGPVRTLFAVGDIKQSIYRFQGAAPEKFLNQRTLVHGYADAAKVSFESVPLNTSFRSTQAVLDAVDAVFGDPQAASGVLEQDIPLDQQRHIAARVDQPGLVEIWPRIAPPEAAEPAPWSPPVERLTVDSAATLCANMVAKRIARMVGADGSEPEILASKGRPIRAGDVMVLLRKRGDFQNDLIRALKQYGVAVAGADRLQLADHMAVQDCMALAEAALFPEDDLTLACVLKGPFIGWNEEQLFEAAHYRELGQSLWSRLQELAVADDGASARLAAAVVEKFRNWRQQVRALRPFGFFAQILESEGGRATLRNRMGAEVDDPLDEILDLAQVYERGHAGAMQGFLHWFAADSNEIKRDMEQGSDDLVRIMTVHGAKGLQAPVVFLPQTVSHQGNSGPDLEWAPKTPRTDKPILMWKPPNTSAPDQMAEAKDARKRDDEQETRRLLYVAMTRAEDRLYVCGWDSKRAAPEGNWHDLVWSGLSKLTLPVVDPDLAAYLGEAPEVLRFVSGHKPVPQPEARPTAAALAHMPAWMLAEPAADPIPGKPLMPSRPDQEDPPVLSPLAVGGIDRFRRGNVMHRLLESLPDVPLDRRAAVATRYLDRAVADWPAHIRAELVSEALKVLDIPEAQILFGPQSQAEVPIAGLITADTGPRLLSGQIDRLAITDDAILLADYKTNRPPPKDPKDVPEIYRRQMASYVAALAAMFPEREIRTFLLWTDGPIFMEVTC